MKFDASLFSGIFDPCSTEFNLDVCLICAGGCTKDAMI